MTREHIHFVTGRLAEKSLRSVVMEVAEEAGFAFSVDVLPITVAALMTPAWIARHLNAPAEANRIVVPGYCSGELQLISDAAGGMPVQRGPIDLRQLPEFFGRPAMARNVGGDYDIQILAEINHAPRWRTEDLLAEAGRLASDGADLIDVGCEPGAPWSGVGECVRALRDHGHRVSIDSFHPTEVADAVTAGAELVLSVNQSNREAARDWECPVVAIPDEPGTLGGLDETLEYLTLHRVPHLIDPILEPIGCGFAASLERYLSIRRRYRDEEMLMGIGNLTELTDVDSAGVNVLLMGFCQELGIRKVLTTQVINWARSSVKECDLARRLVFQAVEQQIPPKHIEPSLVLLRDPSLPDGTLDFDALASQIKDHNIRVYAEDGQVHAVSAGIHLANHDPFQLFEQLSRERDSAFDAGHAFYLGFEMAKAVTALVLGKRYEQDESLDWGFLTVSEDWHRIK